MTVLVSGDREWRDVTAIRRELSRLPPDTLIVHGGCRGADTIAGRVAEELGLAVRAYPAAWRQYGRDAGPARNGEMLQKEKPDLVLAFHPDLSRSRGTRNMVMQARWAGVEVRIVTR